MFAASQNMKSSNIYQKLYQNYYFQNSETVVYFEGTSLGRCFYSNENHSGQKKPTTSATRCVCVVVIKEEKRSYC